MPFSQPSVIKSPSPAARPLPLEVFVHGALCVAYSGQCLTSESLGGRSANRGECAQACRMPYELVSDGQTVDLGDRRYLLSPQDLSGLEVLPDLVRAGVRSLKIEGRLKSAEYVASITRVYRRALDQIAAAAAATAADQAVGPEAASPPRPDRLRRPATNWKWPLAEGCTQDGSGASTTKNWPMPASVKSGAFIWGGFGRGTQCCPPSTRRPAQTR